jgi:hypothetical protein
MPESIVFSDVVDAVDEMTVEEQETLLAIVRRRLLERGRQRVLRDVEEGRAALARGDCKLMTAAEIMKEVRT